ncbi:hypothetical protein [Roseicella aerolata]|uniref:Uncharacterized protein n=1 Tax=Roseicella aerolata TaxID=2883479 RepID=A0A9X1IGS7_9PROT|nr:hypothetical protein [Roseicella aerolata]MCB4824277.1 hypothetical protein [Roseicella aerolata]
MVTLHVRLAVDLVESVLWSSGARTIQEVVELALLNMLLNHMPAAVGGGKGGAVRFWTRSHMRRLARRGRP